MKTTRHSIATASWHARTRALLLSLALSLTGCASSLQPVRPAVYDFGPGALSAAPVDQAALAPLILGSVEASPALDSVAIQYRLLYADALQLKPYAQARWSMAPALLLRQRLSEQLGQSRALLNPGESGLPGATPLATLRLELEEFSQLFDSPSQSSGLLRLRVTLVQSRANGETQVVQRAIIVRRPAASPDASGGVQALTAASDAAVQEIEAWLRSLRP